MFFDLTRSSLIMSAKVVNETFGKGKGFSKPKVVSSSFEIKLQKALIRNKNFVRISEIRV